MNVLQVFKQRLSKLGIEIEYAANIPWIYLNKVNGKRVVEKFYAEHGFTIAFLPLNDDKMKILDIPETFKIIRKYLI